MPTNADKLLASFDLPPEKAVKRLKELGIDTSGNVEEMLALGESYAFVITRVTNADLLQDVLGLLTAALEEKQSYADFKKGVREGLATKGWLGRGKGGEELTPWRIELIYRNNLQSALSAGRFSGQQANKGTRPYLVYDAVDDNRTTEGCRGRDGIVRPVDDPIWMIYYPPNHHRCRANVYSASEREIARDGLTVTSDDDLSKVPPPQKGWDRSPMEPYKPDTSKYADPIGKALEKELAKT